MKMKKTANSQKDEVQRLAEVFERLGCDDPQAWAHSEVKEGIPQLARFCFLKWAWQFVLADGDTAWIDERIRFFEEAPSAPGAYIGGILRKWRKKVDPHDLSEIVRVMQFELLDSLCTLLDGALAPPEEWNMPITDYALFQLDDDGRPIKHVHSLHEQVAELDPTGRQMQPPDDAAESS